MIEVSMDDLEMDALLDVLEYDALASYGEEDPGAWTWDRPGLENVKVDLVYCRGQVKRWKEV